VSKTLMKLVGHSVLKGVWKGRPYPIIWYRPDWTRFAEDFDYDEFLASPTLTQARDGSELRPDRLTDVVRQVGADKNVASIEAALRAAKRAKPSDDALPGIPELHVAAACVFVPGREVLMRRRPATVGVQAGKWDFGCVTATGRRPIRDELVDGYRQKYAMSIAPIPARLSGPLSDYSFERERRTINGVVLGATAERREAKHYKDCEIAWHSLDQPPPDGSVQDAGAVLERLRQLFPSAPPT